MDQAVQQFEGTAVAGAEAHALPADPMVHLIERVVMDADLPMERVSAMFDLRERQMEKANEQAFNAAFAAAMAEMPVVPRSGLNKHSGQAYSTLNDLINTSRPVLSKHGLSLNWSKKTLGDGQIEVTAHVRHTLGHQITTSDQGARDSGKAMNPLQGGGSTETYLKRYTGFSILGLSSGDEIDDDGQAVDGGTITADQFIVLKEMLEKADANEERFLAHFKIKNLYDLPERRFGEADRLLSQQARAKSKAQA